MYNPIYEKLAKIVVEYSLEVDKGHEVMVVGPAFAKEMFQALNVELLKAGAHSTFLPRIEGVREEFFRLASDEQLEYVTEAERASYEKFDRLIQITGDYNTRRYSNSRIWG